MASWVACSPSTKHGDADLSAARASCDAAAGGTLTALIGNVIGGTVIFAALAYAQVREEI